MVSDKAALVSLLAAEINPDLLVVNSGKSKADFLVLLEVVPEKLLLKYINEQKKDLLITVSRIREEAERVRGNVPRSFSGFYQVKIWTIDKLGVDGDALRDLAFEEIKRVFEQNPSSAF